MDHLIRFTTAEGVEGTHHAGGLDEALSFIERIRNVEGASEVHLFRLTEVPLEFRTYYRVEVAGGAPAPVPTPAVTSAGEVEAVVPELVEVHGPPPVPAEQGPRLVSHELPGESPSANGRRLFSR